MKICEYIDSVLKEKGMSRRKLAINAGISPSSLQSAFERNSSLSLEMLLPIVKVLNLDMEEVINNGGFDDFNGEYIKIFPPELEEWQRVVDKKTGKQAFSSKAEYDEWKKTNTKDKRKSLLNAAFDELNVAGQIIAVERVEELTEIPKYQKEQKELPQVEEPSEAE